MPSFANLVCAALLFSSSVTAHMKLQSPVPFGKDSLDTSPLKPDGSDFPCKQRSGVYAVSKMNTMAVGENQTMSFDGSASHGGGSCEIIISKDKNPTKDSVWKIIQVMYECPTGGDSGGSHPFSYSLPQIASSQYTLGWLWYNKVGNRELYMNCAPIQVTGGSDSKDVFDSLPNAYIINISNGCTTVESADAEIPNVPDDMVSNKAQSMKAATGPSCAAIAAAMTKGTKSAPTAPADSGTNQTTSPAASEAQATSAASYATSGASSATSSSMDAPTSTSAPTVAATSAVAPYSTMTVSKDQGVFGPGSTAGSAAAPVGTGSSSSSSGASSGTCTTDGEIVCNGATQFGICDHGKVVYQAVAAGTQCKNGAISKRSDSNVHIRRHARHAGKH